MCSCFNVVSIPQACLQIPVPIIVSKFFNCKKLACKKATTFLFNSKIKKVTLYKETRIVIDLFCQFLAAQAFRPEALGFGAELKKIDKFAPTGLYIKTNAKSNFFKKVFIYLFGLK